MRVRHVALVALVALGIVPAASAQASQHFEVVFLAVGQGDAALYRGPCGEVGLVDANRGAAEDVLSQLDAWGRRSALQWINVSHYDADHLGDVEDIARAEGVNLEAVYDRGGDRDAKDSQTYRSYYDWVTGGGLRQPVALGETFTLCSGEQQVTFEVVSVGTDGTAAGGVAVTEENDKGVCVHATYGVLDVASCGDVNGTNEGSRADVESAVAPAYGDVEVVKVNHHGSRFSSNQTYVSTLSPELAVISVGSNSFGHPSQAVTDRWDAVADVAQTQTSDGAMASGDISVTAAGDSAPRATASHSEFAATYSVDEAETDSGPTATARDIADACPEGQVTEDGFGDVTAGNPHEAAVDCVAWWQVARGTSAAAYTPAAPVTRAQMATFLARLVERSGGSLPERASDHFPDDEGNPHEGNINRLAEAGLVLGAGEGYHPEAAVSRAQMATFLVRTTNHRTGTALQTGGDYFPDDAGSPHEANIDAAAEAGFAAGTGDGTYAPSVAVRRDQMASFLARVLDLLVQEGHASLPELSGPPATEPQLTISEVVADPEGEDVQPDAGEYVALANTGEGPVDLTGWYLRDEADHRLETCGMTVEAGTTARVYTGPGSDTADRCYNDLGSAVLNNGGDTLRLFNRDQLVDTVTS